VHAVGPGIDGGAKIANDLRVGRIRSLKLAALIVGSLTACDRQGSSDERAPPEPSEAPAPPKSLRGDAPAGIVCSDGDEVDMLADLRPAEPVDYVATRFFGSKPGYMEEHFSSQRGKPCATASEGSACKKALAAVGEPRIGLAPGCMPESCAGYLVYQRGDEVGSVGTVEALRAWLGKIDTATEAVLLAWAENHRLGGCAALVKERMRSVDDGYLLVTEKLTKSCNPIETTRFVLNVGRDGAIRTEESEVISRKDGCI
jgi:hypothetical protein